MATGIYRGQGSRVLGRSEFMGRGVQGLGDVEYGMSYKNVVRIESKVVYDGGANLVLDASEIRSANSTFNTSANLVLVASMIESSAVVFQGSGNLIGKATRLALGETTFSGQADLIGTLDIIYAPIVISIEDLDTPVQEGDTMVVDVLVENVDPGQENNRTFYFNSDSTQRDTKDVDLTIGEQNRFQMSWDTAKGDEGVYLMEVDAENRESTEPHQPAQEYAQVFVGIPLPVLPEHLAFLWDRNDELPRREAKTQTGFVDRNLSIDRIKRKYELDNPSMRNTNWEELKRFRENVEKSAGKFLFKDVDEFKQGRIEIGTGDGATKVFDLRRKTEVTYQDNTVDKQLVPEDYIVPTSVRVWVNGTIDRQFLLKPESGVIEFLNPPSDGDTIEAEFEFWIRSEFVGNEFGVTVDSAPLRNVNFGIREVI